MPSIIARIVLAAAVVTACGLDTTNGPPGPALQAVVVRPNPHNAISVVVRVTARGFDSAFVRYWRPGAPALRTPAHAFGGDSLARIAVLGLDPAADYRFETDLVAGSDPARAVDTASFMTGSLPAWIPAAVPVGTDTAPGFLALSYPEGPVIIDNRGAVRWYFHSPDATLNTFQAQADGRYTLFGLTDSPRAFRVLDELGDTVATLQCVGYPTRFHDLLVLPDGESWITCDETRIMDLTGLGGLDSVVTTWTVVQHLSADGRLLFEWRSADHFDITDVPASERMGRSVNATHGNGLAIDGDATC